MDDDNDLISVQDETDDNVSVNSEEQTEEEESHEIASARRIILEIIKQNKTTCWPFMDPVDIEGLGLWDYETKIKEPMCFSKLLEKFDNNEYKTFADVAKDFRLMVENCYRYNTTENPISKKAKRLELIFEGKLSLLSKEIQEKSSIAKTSNGRFATKMEESENDSNSRSAKLSSGLCNGAISDFANDFEGQPRLVYDFVHCEETIIAEDKKQANCRERKQLQILYQQVAAVFVSSLESREETKEIKKCHLLPEIGLFLHLNESYFRLPELSMYNLEMSLMIADDSLYLAKIMTTFLCTYYERNLIAQRSPMSYSVWNKRLRSKLEKWFELASKHLSFSFAADKLFINVEFFKSMNWKNPLSSDDITFLNLTYQQRARVLMALCENQTAFQGVQNNLSALNSDQMRPMTLGEDVAGNTYIYFPQFCGDDVRIYRHLQYGEYHFIDCPEPEPLVKTVKNMKSHLEVESLASCESNDLETASNNDLESHSNVGNSRADTSCTNSPVFDRSSNVSVNDVKVEPTLVKSEEIFGQRDDSDVALQLREILDEILQTVSERCSQDNEEDKTVNQTQVECDKTHCVSNTDTQLTNTSDSEKTPSIDENDVKLKIKNSLLSAAISRNIWKQRKKSAKVKTEKASSPKVEPGFDVDPVSDPDFEERSYVTPKKRKIKNNKSVDEMRTTEVRRSTRKRTSVNYSVMMIEGAREDAKKEQTPSPRKQRRGQRSNRRKSKVQQIEEPAGGFGNVDFELVCDSVDALRVLITSIEDEKAKVVNNNTHKAIVRNVTDLLERLQWLLDQLEPFESRLEKSRFDAKIQLKKEHDELLQRSTTGNTSVTDPWDDEISNKSALLLSNGNTSSSSRVATPNSMILADESEEESDRELRRSRRKPRRYEEDVDYVVESSDEDTPSPSPPNQFLYDEFDEVKMRLIPAALDELESSLTDQSMALKRLLARERMEDSLDGGGSLRERRTRQKIKRQNKTFRRVLNLAFKNPLNEGPSLLPLIRPDHPELQEVIERVLAKEAVARQQRKTEREEAERKRRAANQQRRKEIRSQRSVNKQSPLSRADDDVTKPRESMWTSPKRQTFSGGATVTSPNRALPPGDAVENVVIRLQNGKVCPALRFTDGRIAPIVRVDNDSKPAASFDALTAGFGSHNKRGNPESGKVPYISLTGNKRNSVASILRKPSVRTPTSGGAGSQQSEATVSSTLINSSSKTQTSEDCINSLTNRGPSNCQSSSTKTSSQAIMMSPRSSESTVTRAPVNYISSGTANVGNLGKFVVKVNPRILGISRAGVSPAAKPSVSNLSVGGNSSQNRRQISAVRLDVAPGQAQPGANVDASAATCTPQPTSSTTVTSQTWAPRMVNPTAIVANGNSQQKPLQQQQQQIRLVPAVVARPTLVQPVQIIQSPRVVTMPVRTPVMLVAANPLPPQQQVSPTQNNPGKRYTFAPYVPKNSRT